MHFPPGVYQDLVTRNGGGSHGCSVCSYDALGNVLSTTDARGFTTVLDRNEMGEVYRVTSPAPYNYKVETYYDANRKVVRIDTEDQQVAYESGDPTDPLYAQFMPSGNGMSGLGVSQVPSIAGPGARCAPAGSATSTPSTFSTTRSRRTSTPPAQTPPASSPRSNSTRTRTL